MLLLELMRSSVCSVDGRCDEATMKESIYVCGARKESTDELTGMTLLNLFVTSSQRGHPGSENPFQRNQPCWAVNNKCVMLITTALS